MTSVLSYARGDDWKSRRWRAVTAALSVAVGTVGIAVDGVPRVARSWEYTFGQTRPPTFAPSATILAVYLVVSLAALAASAMLVVAGVAASRWPTAGRRLHLAYAGAMLPVALLLAMLIGAFVAADPVAPPAMAIGASLVYAIWFAAYPTFVAIVMWREPPASVAREGRSPASQARPT